MINPIVLKVGGYELRAFTASIIWATLLGGGVLLWTARRLQQPMLRWFDVGLGAVLGGVVGARLFHVVLEWAYFRVHTDQITTLANGGLDWHGALLGGLLGAAMIARLRSVPLQPFSDAIALIFPLGALATWSACGVAACAYGAEVRTLADFPAWLVIEAPDVYGNIAPRLNLPQIGIVLGLLVYSLVLALTARHRASGYRFWIGLGLFSFGMALLEFFRGDYAISVFGHRADQILDLLLLLFSALMIGIIRLRNAPHNVSALTADHPLRT